jgi:hypothetical protein
MRRETGLLQLLAPNLLMGGKGADLVIRGNVVLNKMNLLMQGLSGEMATSESDLAPFSQ